MAAATTPAESWLDGLGRLLTPQRQRAVLIAYFAISAAISGLFVFAHVWLGVLGWDARAYWSVDLAAPYAGAYHDRDFFPYAPPAALAASTFAILPWPVFLTAWIAAMIAVLRWLAGSWIVFGLLLVFLPVVDEVAIGNIHLLLAGAIVLGFRWPAAWAFVLLTKVTPGIGLLWFAIRREWRSLGLAIGATAVIAALTFILLPSQWAAWVQFLAQGSDNVNVPVLPRLVAAALIVSWGALTNRQWTVIMAAIVAVPNFSLGTLAMVAALPALFSTEKSLSRGVGKRV